MDAQNYLYYEIIKQIEEMSSALMLPYDIAAILEIDQKQFIEMLRDEDSEFSKSFKKGYLKTQFTIQKNAFTENSDDEDDIKIIDVQKAEFQLAQLLKFKSKLIIQLA